jgi:hypothetical protein
MKTPKSTAGPRRVALSDTPQGKVYSVPQPTYWAPDELDRKSEGAEKTPCPLQSPEFKVYRDDDDDIRALKARMDRQEDLMQKMMHEISSLRQELQNNASNTTEPESIRKNENMTRDGVDPAPLFGRRDVREGAPYTTAHANQVRDYAEPVRSFEPVEMKPKRVSEASPGATFVAEFSELFELDSGQHALLASIMDRNTIHNQIDRFGKNEV